MMSSSLPSLLDVGLFTARKEHECFDLYRAETLPPRHSEPENDEGFFVLTRQSDVWEAATNTEKFKSGLGTQIADKRAEGKGAPSVHNADAPYHRYLRDFGRRALAQPLLDLRRSRVREIVRSVILSAPKDEDFDFVEQVALKIPMTVFGEVLGIPVDDRAALVRSANTMSSVLASPDEQESCRAELFSYFRELAAERRKHSGNDVASVLVAPNESGDQLNDEELEAYFLLLVVAGNETTRFLLAGGLEQFLLQPEAMEHLRREPSLIPSAVEEMIRWVSPVIHMRRTVVEDTRAFGMDVVAGTKFVLYFSAANRDPSVFQDPHKFCIDRTPNKHVGFGAGHHFCMGAYLARLEVQIFLEEFLSMINECQLIGEGERIPSYWFAGLKTLPVRWS
jgi:cytochrome P450